MKKGILICFVGIDGSGKTTLAKGLENNLRRFGISCKYMWCGWRGFESPLFKPLVNLIKKFYKKTSAPDRLTKTISFNVFALFDYVLRVYPAILFSLYRYDVVIADRYVYDVIVGFLVSGSKGVTFIQKLLNLFPKPYLIFFIEIPEIVAYKRKDDIPSPDYLSEQKKIYLKLLTKNNKNLIIVDGTKSKEDLLNMILGEVIKRCQKS